jgi:hypothetical protein
VTRLGLLAGAVLLIGCGLQETGIVAEQYELVIVNESREPQYWSVEQPDGAMTRFEVEPCSSHSSRIDVGRRWEVEWGATYAVTSADVAPLDGVFTVVEIRFDRDGLADVGPVRAANVAAGAPTDLDC